MSYPRRPNAPTLPVTRTPRGVPYSNAAQPDVSPRDSEPVAPPRDIYPYAVSTYDAKPVNAAMFYESFTGVAPQGDGEISSAADNLVFGENAGEFIVGSQRRLLIRGIAIAFYSGRSSFYDSTPYGIASGFAEPSDGGGNWSILLNDAPAPGFARRAIVGGPGEIIKTPTYILAEEGTRVSVRLRFAIATDPGEASAVYGWLWGDDLMSTNVNLPFEPLNLDAIPVEG